MNRHRYKSAGIGVLLGMVAALGAQANPQGAQVIHGQVTIGPGPGGALNITNSPGAIVNWQSFSVDNGEVTRFIQQSSSSAVLNRVVGQDPSQILGQLLSNGRVFVVNPHGIVFGPNSRVDTAGLLASTLDIDNDDFIAGRLQFDEGDGAGVIENHGLIHVAPGGEVVLIAPQIENSGVIQADDGRLLLAAGRKVTLTSLDTKDVEFEVQAPDDTVVNLGQLIAKGGTATVLAGSIEQRGQINANTIRRDAEGRIVLAASNDIELAGGSTTHAVGEVGDVNDGGEIRVIAEQDLTVRAGAEVRVDGGTDGGDGGFIELSGHQGIRLDGDFSGDAHVEGYSDGSLFIDPTTILIDTGGGTDLDPDGIILQGEAPATMIVTPADLTSLTASFTNVHLQSAGLLAVNAAISDSDMAVGSSLLLEGATVEINNAIGTLALPFAHDLTVNASNTIDVRAPIYIADNHDLTLNAAAGDLTFDHVSFLNYTVQVGSTVANAAGDMVLSGSNVVFQGGDMSTSVNIEVAGAGNQTITAINDIVVQANPLPDGFTETIFIGSGKLTTLPDSGGTQRLIAVNGALRMLGGVSTGDALDARIESHNGPQRIDVATTLELNAQNVDNTLLHIEALGTVTGVAQEIIVNGPAIGAQGSMMVDGGFGLDSAVVINTDGEQTITVRGDGNLTVRDAGSGSATGNVGIRSSGNQTITLDGNFDVQAGDVPIFVEATSGAQDITARQISFDAATGTAAIDIIGATQSLTADSLALTSGTDVNADVYVEARSSTQTVTAGLGDLQLLSGGGGEVLLRATTDQTLTVAGGLSVVSGTTVTGTSAVEAGANQTVDATYVNVQADVATATIYSSNPTGLQDIATTGAPPAAPFYGLRVTALGGGQAHVVSTGQQLLDIVGSDLNAIAMSGDVEIHAGTSQTISQNAGGTGAINIGHPAATGSSRIILDSGVQTVTGDNIALRSGNAAVAASIEAMPGVNQNVTSAGTLDVISGGASLSEAFITGGSNITVSAGGDITLRSGASAGAIAVIGADPDVAVDVTSTGGKISLDSLAGADVGIGSSLANATVTMSAADQIEFLGSAVKVGGISGAPVTGDITLQAGTGGSGDLILGDAQIYAGGNISLQSSTAIIQDPGPGTLQGISLDATAGGDVILPAGNAVQLFSATGIGIVDLNNASSPNPLMLGYVESLGGDVSINNIGPIYDGIGALNVQANSVLLQATGDVGTTTGAPIFTDVAILNAIATGGSLGIINVGDLQVGTAMADAITIDSGGTLDLSGPISAPFDVFLGGATGINIFNPVTSTSNAVTLVGGPTVIAADVMAATTIDLLGNTDWQSGVLMAPTINSSGNTIISTPTPKSLDGMWNNTGLITWLDGPIAGVGTLNNQTTGAFNVGTDQTFSPAYVNDGIITKTAGTGVSTFAQPYTGIGDIMVLTGTLDFPLGLNQPTGVTTIRGGGVLSASAGPINLGGPLDWEDGSITATSLTTSGAVSMLTPGTKNLMTPWLNNGNVTWADGPVTGTGTVNNQLVFDVQADQTFAPAVTNFGNLMKTAGPGVASFTAPFVNNNTTTAASGTLAFPNGYSQSLGLTVINGGSIDTGGPGLDIMGNLDWISGTINGPLVTHGTTNVLGPGPHTLNGAWQNDGILDWNAGDITGAGDITNLPIGSFNVAGAGMIDVPVNNQGVMTKALGGTAVFTAPVVNSNSVYANAGVLDFTGGYSQSTGTLQLNGGDLSAGGTGVVALGGTLNWIDGDIFGADLQTSGTTNIFGATPKLLGSSWTNAGIVNWSDSHISGAGPFINTPTGQLFAQSDHDFAPDVQNDGLINKSAGGGVTTFSGDMDQTGTLDIGSGQVVVDGTFDWQAGTVTGGELVTNGLTELTSAAAKNLNSTWTNNGSARMLQGDLLGAGTLSNAVGADLDMQTDNVVAPIVNNAGTLAKTAGTGTSSFSNSVNNTGTVTAATGTLDFNAGYIQSSGTTVINGGAIDTAGPGLDLSGDLDWLSGPINGPLTTHGTTTVAGPGPHDLNGLWTNDGNVTWSSGDVGGSGTFNNLSGGSVDVTGGDAFMVAINNAGDITKSAGGVSTFSGGLNNAGTLTVNAGEVQLPAGYTQAAAGTTVIDGGDLRGGGPGLNIAGTLDWRSGKVIGATLNTTDTTLLSGPAPKAVDTTWNNSGTVSWAGSDIVGTGQLNNGPTGVVNASTDHDFAVNVVNLGTIAKVSSAGTTTFSGNLSNAGMLDTGPGTVSVSGLFDWQAGTVAGTLLETYGPTTLSTASTKSLASVWNNHGVANWAAGSVAGAGTLNNLSTGTFNVTTPGSFAPAVNNTGLLANNPGAGTTVFASAVQNAADVRAQSGTLHLAGGYAHGAPTARAVLAGGNIQGPAGGLVLNDGQLVGNGSIVGHLLNPGGVVSPGASPGLISVLGNYVQGPAGTLLIELAGTTQGSQYDALAVQGSAALNGTLDVTYLPPYTALTSDNFYPVTAVAGLTGDFSTQNLPTGMITTLDSPTAGLYELGFAGAPAGGGPLMTTMMIPNEPVVALQENHDDTINFANQGLEDEEERDAGGAAMMCN